MAVGCIEGVVLEGKVSHTADVECRVLVSTCPGDRSGQTNLPLFHERRRPVHYPHMAMLVAAGFLDNLVLEGDDRRILVKGRTSKEMVLVEDAPEKEVHREKLTTTVVALDLGDGRIEDIAA